MASGRTLRSGQTFSFVKYNWQRAFSGPKQYIVLAVMTLHILWCGNWIREWIVQSGSTYSWGNFTSLNFLEFFIILSNDYDYYFYLMIGLIFLLADCPLDLPGTGYYLLRADRRKWYWGQVSYIVSLVFVFNLYLALLCAVALVPHITFSLDWSPTVTSAVRLSMEFEYVRRFTTDMIALSELAKYISPLTAWIASFAFNMLWMSVLGCLSLALCLYSSSKLGFLVTGVSIAIYRTAGNMGVILRNAFKSIDLIYLSRWAERWYYGTMGHLSSGYQDFGTINFSLEHAIVFFLAALVLSCILGLRWAKRYDFSR